MFIIIQTTTDSKNEAKFLAQLLLHKRLAACVQTQKVQSSYIWKGKIRQKKEYLLTLKSTRTNAKAVERLLRANHSYEVCEFVSFPCIVSKEYGEWIEDSVKSE